MRVFSIFWVTTALFLLLSFRLEAKSLKLKVVTSTPDLAWLASELLQEMGEVKSLLGGYEDVHAVDAVPSYILAASKADVFCFVGVSLELGWVPKVIEKTANQNILPGRDGYCDVGASIETLGKPKGAVDRSMGDVHPEGNPHYYLSLPDLGKAASKMASYFISNLDEPSIQKVLKNLEKVLDKLNSKHGELQTQLQAHFGTDLPVLAQYHGNFSYFAKSYGFRLFGNIEETPGVAPSAGSIAIRAIEAKKSKVAAVLAVPYNARSVVEKFAELAKVPAIIHSDMSQPERKPIKNPLLLQQSLVEKIIEKLPKTAKANP